jgi:hypothetical protein
MNLSPEEMKLVRSAQKAINEAKAALHQIGEDMGDLAKINYDAGRAVEGNAAMRLRGAVIRLRGSLIEAHAIASDALHHGYDDGDVVIFGGGGGRRRP